MPNIRIINHDNGANLGQFPSLNLGIKSTRADLIAFLDHDDLWYPNKIKKQVEVFEKNPDITLVYSNGFAIDEEDRKLFKLLPDGFQEINRIGNILLNCYITTPSAVMMKRDIFEKTGLFKNYLPSCGDHDMWIRISEIGKFHYLSDCFVGHRRHPDQLSKKTTRRMWNGGFVILKDACKRYPYGENVRRKRLAVLYYRLGELELKERKRFKSVLYFLLAGLLDPIRSLKYVKNSGK